MTATTKRFYCSFCGKSDLEVDYIINGCEANICDKCVDICKATIDAARKQKAATANANVTGLAPEKGNEE